MVYAQPGSKRHAVRKGDRDSPLYWVGNEADWDEVRRQPRMALECPERCGTELISVENPAYPYAPRFFRVKPPRLPCDHWEPSPGLGGRESAQHDWLKNAIAQIARDIGYGAVVEHWPTRSDVYVESSPPFCLEIQLRSTSFDMRTRARTSHGAGMCWLIRDSLSTPGAEQALARAQAVRFRVVNGKRRAVQPWHGPPGVAPGDRPRIEVFATIATRPRGLTKPGGPWFQTDGCMDARQFLDESLSGRRRPYDGTELGLEQAAWALDTDVSAYRAFIKNMAVHDMKGPVPQSAPAAVLRRAPFAERLDSRTRAGQRAGDHAKAEIRKQAAAGMTKRIRQIEARIIQLEESRAELAANSEIGSAAKSSLIQDAERELGTLAAQLRILRRQVALLDSLDQPTEQR